MARAKKELVPSAPVTRISGLISRMQKSGTSICTAADMTANWRYIDFCNLRLNLPCLAMEWLFGARGLLAGRLIQLRATYSKGKSSFMYYMYACGQRCSDSYCFHAETEGAAAPPDFIAGFCADPAKMAVAEIQSLEDCLARIDEVIAEIRGGRGGGIDPETGRVRKTKYTDPLDPDKQAPIMVGVDSLSSLGIQDKVEADIADMTKAGQLSKHARVLREYLRTRMGLYRDSQCLLMLATHETAKIETGKKKMFGGGDQKNSMAQEAIGVHATYAVDVDSHTWADNDKGVILGNRITYYTFKNKLSPRYRKLDVFMRTNMGFDMTTTDCEFLLSHPASPLSKDECYRQGGGIKCPELSDRVFKNPEEFLAALYGNEGMLKRMREKLRIRGFGFDFETKYQEHLNQLALTVGEKPGEEADLPTEEIPVTEEA